MTKLMIATPAQNGDVKIDYALCLAATLKKLDLEGIPVSLLMRHSGSLLIAERNLIMNKFLKSDCTHLLMIDSDIGWIPDTVLRLLKHNVDFVGITYPSKKNRQYLFRFEGDVLRIPDENGMLPVMALPGGFVMVSHFVPEVISKVRDDRHFESKDGDEGGVDFYSTFVKDGEFWGEDFAFCRLARSCGIQVFLDTKSKVSHCGMVGEDLYETIKQMCGQGNEHRESEKTAQS